MAKKKATKRTVKRKVESKPVQVTPMRVADAPTPMVGIVVLLFNGLVLPGLGSLIGKKYTSGLLQLILAVLGQIFLGKLIQIQLALGVAGLNVLEIAGLVLVIIAWVWGIFSGIDVIRKSL